MLPEGVKVPPAYVVDAVMERVLMALGDCLIREPLWGLWWAWEKRCAEKAHLEYPPLQWYRKVNAEERVLSFDKQIGYREVDFDVMWKMEEQCPFNRPGDDWRVPCIKAMDEAWRATCVGGKYRANWRLKPYTPDQMKSNLPDYYQHTNWLLNNGKRWRFRQVVPEDAPIWDRGMLDKTEWMGTKLVEGDEQEPPSGDIHLELYRWRRCRRSGGGASREKTPSVGTPVCDMVPASDQYWEEAAADA
jgi:hypothetical protein